MPQVFIMGLDEAYEMARKWQTVCDQYPASSVAPSDSDSKEECRQQAAAGAIAGQAGDPGSASASACAPGSPGSPGSIAQGPSPAALAREATTGAAVCSAAEYEGVSHAPNVEVRSSRVPSPPAEAPENTSAVNPWALPSSESPPPPNSSPSPTPPPHTSDELSELINLSLSPARDALEPSSSLQRYPVTQEPSPSRGRGFAANGADGRWSTEQMLLASGQTKVFAKLSPMDQITALVAGTEAEDVRGVQGSRGSELARDSGAEGSGQSDDELDRLPSLPLSLSAAGEAHTDGADHMSVDPSWREGDVYTSPQHMPAPAQPLPSMSFQDMPPPPAPSTCPGPSTALAGRAGISGVARKNPPRAGRPQPPATREAYTPGRTGGGNGLASSATKLVGNKKASPSAKTDNRATPVKRRKEEVEEEIGGWAELEDGTQGYNTAAQRWDMLDHVKRNEDGQLLKDPEDGDSQLEYLVKWAVDERGRRWQNSWQPEHDLSCPKHIAAFVKRWRDEGNIPLQEHGKNMIFAGGPPCQGMSGYNKGAPTTDIQSHPKNRLIKVFLKLLEWYKPAYTVTEQVVDSAQKEYGIYLRFLIAKATSLRYQVRVHIREAGGDGCPQGRRRVIIFTARQGEQLPPVPAPSHKVAEFNTGICRVMTNCYLYEDDMMKDSPPQCPFQVLCRCPPPPGTPSLEERVRMAEAHSPARLYAQAVVALAEFGSTDGGPSPDGLFKYGLGDNDSFGLGQDDRDFDEVRFLKECPDTAKGKNNQHLQKFDKLVRSRPKDQWRKMYAQRAQAQRGWMIYAEAKRALAELANPSGAGAEVGRLPPAASGPASGSCPAGTRVGNAASSADVGSNLAARAVNAAPSGPASGSCPAGTFNHVGSERPDSGPSAASKHSRKGRADVQSRPGVKSEAGGSNTHKLGFPKGNAPPTAPGVADNAEVFGEGLTGSLATAASGTLGKVDHKVSDRLVPKASGAQPPHDSNSDPDMDCKPAAGFGGAAASDRIAASDHAAASGGDMDSARKSDSGSNRDALPASSSVEIVGVKEVQGCVAEGVDMMDGVDATNGMGPSTFPLEVRAVRPSPSAGPRSACASGVRSYVVATDMSPDTISLPNAACNPEQSHQKKGKKRRKAKTYWSGHKKSNVKQSAAPGAAVSPACTGLSNPVLQRPGQGTGSPGCTGLSTVQPHSVQSHDPVLPSADQCYGHRPYMLNADDYLRVSMVPKEPGASFRNIQGVVVNKATRRACVGHLHAGAVSQAPPHTVEEAPGLAGEGDPGSNPRTPPGIPNMIHPLWQCPVIPAQSVKYPAYGEPLDSNCPDRSTRPSKREVPLWIRP
eukprot:gene8600-34042_t